MKAESRLARQAVLDAAKQYARSSGDCECLGYVHALPVARVVVKDMVLNNFSLAHILACANSSKWPDDLYRVIEGMLTRQTARWYEFVEASALLDETEEVEFSAEVLAGVLRDPFARAYLIKKFGEGDRAGYGDETVWCEVVRNRIIRGDLTRAFDELKKLVYGHPGSHLAREQGVLGCCVEETTFKTLVDELYGAAAARGSVPYVPPASAFKKNEWPELKRWRHRDAIPAAFFYLGYGNEDPQAGPVLAKWYVLQGWRVEKKHARR